MSEYVAREQLEILRKEIDALVRAYEHRAVQIPDLPVEPFDGGPAVRPHTIPGWWQVWSGSICVALLSPEQVAPIVQAAGVVPAEPAKPLRRRRVEIR